MNFRNLAKFYSLASPRLALIFLPFAVFAYIYCNKPLMNVIGNNKTYSALLLFTPVIASSLLMVHQGKKINHIARRLGL